MKIRNLIPFKTSLLSAPINKFLGVALVMLVLLTSSVASAQLFPVQVSPQLTPPYSLKLSDYSTSTTEKLLVNLLLTDVNESDLQVRLRFSISGNSVNIQSKDFVQNAAPIQLTGGIPLRLSNLDLQPYFDLQNLDGITPSEYSKPLPDGLYQFCFEVFDWTTGRPLSEKKCYPVYLVLNDPPFLNLPQNGEQVPARDPQNLIFQWTPRHVNATGVEYEFELRELWDTNVDPQAAFLASPNLYQTTGFANTLLYGPGETSLLEGKTYGWRVRAVVSDGISETAVFKNGGYSEIFYFTYTGKCDAPQYILAKSEGTTTEEITWQQNPDHINYQIQFRKEGGSNNVWFESETVETKKKLFFLEAETTYEYRVGGQCVQNGGYSYSAINTFTTPGKEDASEYNCGIPPEIVITNQDPLQLLGVNDVFTAGDFPVTVKEVNGGNGNYTGWGFIVVPYLGDTQIRVTFNNIQINTDKQLTNGIVETEYDEKFATTGGAGMSDVSELTELIEGDNDIDELNVNFVIPPDYFEDYITVEDGQVVIRNPNDAQVRTSPLGDDKVIVDSAGNTYHVDAEGNVTKGGKIDEGGPVNADNVEGVTKNGDIESLTAKGITVTFNSRGTYGYDKLPSGINNTKLNEEYKTIKDAQGANYEIVNHVAEKNKSSLITATVSISNSDYTIDDLIFKTKQGELLTHTKATNNTVNLSVQGRYTFENEPIYAVVKSKQDTTKQQTAGAFNLWHLSRKTVDVVLVSVDGAQLPTALELNTIFNQAATTLNIETKSVSLTNGLLGADNKLEIGDKPWLNTYNQEQKAIIADLKQKIDYQKDKYYVFTFNSSFNTTKSIAGFMPLKRQFGFVFNGGLSSDEEGKGDLAKVTAHEVAHGIFALQHPFTTYGDDIKGKTPWLMDYANGDLLSHMDWAQIHNPNLKFYIFQDEEDGEYDSYELVQKVFQEIRCAYLNNNIDDSAQLQTIKGYLSRISEFRSLINLADETIEFCVEYDDEKELIFNKNITPAEGDFDKSNLEWLYNLMNVTPPKKFKYKYTFGGLTIYTQKSDFESYINPTKERVREDLMNVWSKINIENGITQSEILKLKSIAACATQLISTPNRIKLIRDLSKGNLLESREDLILDILQTTPKEEQIYILDFLYDEFDVFTSLYQKMGNSNLVRSENNKSRFINTIYSFWEDSSYSKSDNTTYSYINNESPKIIGYDDKGKFERGFTSRELKFKLEKSNKAIKVIKEDPGDMDDQAITIYEYTYHPFQPIVIYSIEDENKVNVISNTVPAFFFMGIEDIKDANARAAAWGLTFDSLLMVTGVGEISALRNLSGVYKATKATILGVEITTSALDIILNYSTICNGNEESCQKIKKINFWLQLGSLSSDLLTQRIIRQSAEDALGYSNIPEGTRKELEVLAGKTLANAGSELTRLTTILQKAEFTTIFNKLKNLPSTPSRVLRYASKDAFRDEFVRLHSLNTTGVKSLDNVLDDFDNLISNHSNVADIEKYVDELLQSPSKFKGGAYGLEILNDLPPSLGNKTLSRFEASIDDLEDAISGCRFDLQFSDGVKLVYVETKNYAKTTSFTSSFYNQFKSYISGSNITSIDDIKYFFRANENITKAERVTKFKNMLKSEAKAKEIFEANETLFKKIKMENGIDKIEDWEDFQSLMTSNTISENHEIFNFIEVY